ncbi:MAG: hypothetical protein ABSB42_20105 [Tepidisphaeraceae bacterium]|jgi:hypothetical protein
MNPYSMPMELVELENRLRARPGDEPTAGLRDRVLQAVAESVLPEQPSSAGPWDGWYWAAVAAGILIVLNLSMISASQDEFSARPALSPNQTSAELQTLRMLEAQQEGIFK